ncbi:hypothetical protein [Helicobacter sp. T3_23-1056]
MDNLSDFIAQIKTPIDFESINQTLESLCKISVEFLEQNLATL